ncbi:MAG: hypothetical protein CL607_08875 [Anaerolineaceae bacterium]|nr:hypothetical protein [Anaerolineaceae bacterium]
MKVSYWLRKVEKLPIQVKWLDSEKRIIGYAFADPVSLEDIYEALQNGYDISADLPYRIYIVYDFRNFRSLPPNIFSTLSYLRTISQDNVELRLLVGPSMMLASLLRILSGVIPQLKDSLKVVETLDEAMLCIRDHMDAAATSDYQQY